MKRLTLFALTAAFLITAASCARTYRDPYRSGNQCNVSNTYIQTYPSTTYRTGNYGYPYGYSNRESYTPQNGGSRHEHHNSSSGHGRGSGSHRR